MLLHLRTSFPRTFFCPFDSLRWSVQRSDPMHASSLLQTHVEFVSGKSNLACFQLSLAPRSHRPAGLIRSHGRFWKSISVLTSLPGRFDVYWMKTMHRVPHVRNVRTRAVNAVTSAKDMRIYFSLRNKAVFDLMAIDVLARNNVVAMRRFSGSSRTLNVCWSQDSREICRARSRFSAGIHVDLLPRLASWSDPTWVPSELDRLKLVMPKGRTERLQRRMLRKAFDATSVESLHKVARGSTKLIHSFPDMKKKSYF